MGIWYDNTINSYIYHGMIFETKKEAEEYMEWKKRLKK